MWRICLAMLLVFPGIVMLFTFSDVIFGESFVQQGDRVIDGYYDHGAHRYRAPEPAWSLWETRFNNGLIGVFVALVVCLIVGAGLTKVEDTVDERRRRARMEEKK